MHGEALLAIHTRLMKDVPNPDYNEQLVRDLAQWKLCGTLSQAPPPSELTNEHQLTAAGIVGPAWGRMADIQVPPATAQVLGVKAEEEVQPVAEASCCC